MITKKKKYTLYYVMALACGLVASFFIYSCSADGYYSEEIEKNEVTNTRALSSKMINNGSIAIKAIAILMDVVGSFATSAPIFPATLPLARYWISVII